MLKKRKIAREIKNIGDIISCLESPLKKTLEKTWVEKHFTKKKMRNSKMNALHTLWNIILVPTSILLTFRNPSSKSSIMTTGATTCFVTALWVKPPLLSNADFHLSSVGWPTWFAREVACGLFVVSWDFVVIGEDKVVAGLLIFPDT